MQQSYSLMVKQYSSKIFTWVRIPIRLYKDIYIYKL